MITLLSETQAGRLFRYLREQRRLTRRELARRLFVSNVTVGNREAGLRSFHLGALIDTAHVLGFRVALVPQRHPGARDTGTGWPA